jgi:hypothetical protein
MFTMRFTMRSAAADPGARADSYAAMLDMVAWAETRGGAAAPGPDRAAFLRNVERLGARIGRR